MTTEQRNLILQAIGALKAALGPNTPELPFMDEFETVKDLGKIKHMKTKTRMQLIGLYERFGTEWILWGSESFRRACYELNIPRHDQFIMTAEGHKVIEIHHEPLVSGRGRRIKSFRFIKPIK